jgi:hypothetical protein
VASGIGVGLGAVKTDGSEKAELALAGDLQCSTWTKVASNSLAKRRRKAARVS